MLNHNGRLVYPLLYQPFCMYECLFNVKMSFFGKNLVFLGGRGIKHFVEYFNPLLAEENII